MAAAVCEATVVGEDSADAGEDRVGMMTQGLHMSSGFFACDPSAIVFRSRDFTVQRDSSLKRHERPACAHKVQKSFVKFGGASRVFRRKLDVNAGVAKLSESSSTNEWVGVFHRCDDAADAGCDDRIGAGRRATLMGMRFERDIHRRAPSFFAGLCESQNFGMLHARGGIESLADHFLALNDHCTDARVGADTADALRG